MSTRTQLLSARSDLDWLHSVHLNGIPLPPFQSFLVHGSEDCPDLIILYADAEPLYTDDPVATIYFPSPTSLLRTIVTQRKISVVVASSAAH